MNYTITYAAKDIAEFRSLMAEFGNVIKPSIIKPCASQEAQGEHEIAFKARYGGTRITPAKIALCELSGSREDMFARLTMLLNSKQVELPKQGYTHWNRTSSYEVLNPSFKDSEQGDDINENVGSYEIDVEDCV